MGFCITWLVLSNYNKISPLKKQFYINHASHLNCEINNLIYVIICQWCKKEYIGGTSCLVKEWISIYIQNIRGPEYQLLTVEEHLGICKNGKLRFITETEQEKAWNQEGDGNCLKLGGKGGVTIKVGDRKPFLTAWRTMACFFFFHFKISKTKSIIILTY